jgi:hypothetical protein
MDLFLMLLAICAGGIAFTFLGVTLARRLVGRGVGEGHNDVSAAIFNVGGVIFAVFLAFLVITVWQAHDNARAVSSDEGALLSTLYRGTAAMEPDSGRRLRAVIREYTGAVIKDEWPLQAQTGEAHPKARTAALNMLAVYGAMGTAARERDQAIDQMQLGLIAQIISDRTKRRLLAQNTIPPVIWWVSLMCATLVIFMSFFLYLDRDWPHVLISGMLAAMIFMLVYVMYLFDRPFGGMMPLAPDAFVDSLKVYDSVDQTLLLPTSADGRVLDAR